jgi:hypothetical protein
MKTAWFAVVCALVPSAAYAWDLETVEYDIAPNAEIWPAQGVAAEWSVADYGYGPKESWAIAYTDIYSQSLKVAQGQPSGPWSVDEIETGWAGYFPAVAMDDLGNPYITYWESTGHRVRHAWPKAGGNCGSSNWQCETVMFGQPAKMIASAIAVNYATLERHVVLGAGDGLYYTSRADLCGVGKCAWTAPELIGADPGPSSNWGKRNVRIKLQNGQPRIVFLEGDAPTWLARTGNVWAAEKISATSGAQTTDFYIDSSGNQHVCIVECGHGGCRIKYAKRTGPNAWSTTYVDSAVPYHQYNTCSISGASKPYISYHRGTDLVVAAPTGVKGAWITEIVDDGGDTGYFSTIRTSPAVGTRVAYLDFTWGDLRFAWE